MKISNDVFSMLLLKDVSDAIIASDTIHRILEWNPAAEKLYGFKRSEVLGRTIVEVTRREYPGLSRTDVLEQFERDGFWAGNVRERRRDGQVILVHTRVSKVYSPGGEFIGLVAVNRDITSQQQAQEELIQKSRLELMGFVLGSVSHSLNNHLTAVLGSLSVARHYAGSLEKVQNYLYKAEQASLSIRSIIRQLMIVSGDIHSIFQAVDLLPILHQAMASYGNLPDIRFHISIDQTPPCVWGNPNHLLQVFHNVFDNAVEAMKNKGDISIVAEEMTGIFPGQEFNSKGMVIRISDTGPGIPADLHARVFDPFFSTNDQASGLGLAVSRSIVRQHGGTIMMETAESGGARVVITLPVPEPEWLRRTEVSPVSILIFEPDDLMCQVLCDLIRQIGFGVTGVMTRRDAINAFRKARENGHDYSLVIMDLDGLDPVTEPSISGVLGLSGSTMPILAASANAVHPLREEYMLHGLAGWLLKPFKLETLEYEINRILGV